MKPFFKNKSVKKPQTPVPRTMEEIQKINAELGAKAAQVQYLVYAYTRELEKINQSLESLNYEAAERNKLDDASKSATKLEEAPVTQWAQ